MVIQTLAVVANVILVICEPFSVKVRSVTEVDEVVCASVELTDRVALLFLLPPVF